MLVADTLTGDLTLFENADRPIEWAATQQLRGVSEGNATRFALDRREPLARRARGVPRLRRRRRRRAGRAARGRAGDRR